MNEIDSFRISCETLLFLLGRKVCCFENLFNLNNSLYKLKFFSEIPVCYGTLCTLIGEYLYKILLNFAKDFGFYKA